MWFTMGGACIVFAGSFDPGVCDYWFVDLWIVVVGIAGEFCKVLCKPIEESMAQFSQH